MSALGAAVGAALDHIAGEPPPTWHPVARYGALMQAVERRTYAESRVNGMAHLAIGAACAGAVGCITQACLGRRAGTVAAVALCAAGRMLDTEAQAVAAALRSEDLAAARWRVRSLVGRNPEELGADELARAVVESVAENLVDAVTATIFWGSVGGPIGAFVHRAVNTLDALVGHRDDRYRRFGWASARLDDAANFVPARLTCLAVAAARPRRAREVWRVVRRDARRHPSPNGGVVEAAFAAALGIRLGGVNVYGAVVENRGPLGEGRSAAVGDIDAAVRLRRSATVVFTAAALTAAGVVSCYRRRSR